MDIGKNSNIGTKRLENQDRVDVLQRDTFALLLLCDGMGGHFGGSLASTITINVFKNEFFTTLPESFDSNNINNFVQWFQNTLEKVKTNMKNAANGDEAKMDMGTTLTGAFVDSKSKTIIIFNIGDSRTFLLTKNGDLHQITKDHNVYNKLVLEDGWSKIDALKFKGWRALTSALGPLKKTKLEIHNVSDHYNIIQMLLSTSDGVHGFLDNMAITQILKTKENPDDTCEILVEQAMLNHSNDNLSAGIIVLDEK
ncbi:protein phosphatase 2c domain-containing protein [Mycoplasmopsis columbina SF7]|uniref:Protein phosphatase 2c domain-containing protein n=1 Tax=Mycoplasmopsis columbina SF7 TaxID=1037410 RepID=F9UKQ0_9BACT|nr:PP2C family serine/threonine-protein phosphatase [Mycoplasmopsis columbina]EGV00255.1 protein phosphatase 2c domain-containing protein [Mycoplasmopsis columbina SF7]